MDKMFQQFENDINTLLTSGVRNVTGAAQEMMNTAGTIKAQETKIKSLMKTKKSLKKQIGELQEKLKKSEHKVNKYRKKLALLEGKDKSNEGRAVEVVEDEQEELLVLSHNSEELPVLDDNSAEDVDSEEGHSNNSTPNPNEPEEAVISDVDEGSEKDFENVSVLDATTGSFTSESTPAIETEPENENESELDVIWNKMTHAIEESGKLREEIVELKRLHRDQCLGLKTENSNLTIELEDYRLSSRDLQEQIVELNQDKLTQRYEIQNLTINYNFWKRNFYIQLFLIAVYVYLTNVKLFHNQD